MITRISRSASTLAAAAVLSMAVAPAVAEARGWRGGWGGGWGHRHHDRVDAGDIFAGILIIGGIAAIASAASKADRDRRARTSERDRDYRDDREARQDRGDTRYGRDDRPSWQEGRGIDNAVNQCVGEVERSARVDSVENVGRDGDGWRVEGRVAGGRSFACAIGTDGRIRSTTIDGRAALSDEADGFVSEPVVQPLPG
jgi:hypothetical protein